MSVIFLIARNIFPFIVIGGLYPQDAMNTIFSIWIDCSWYKSITTLPPKEWIIKLAFFISKAFKKSARFFAYSCTVQAVGGVWDDPNHGKSGATIGWSEKSLMIQSKLLCDCPRPWRKIRGVFDVSPSCIA